MERGTIEIASVTYDAVWRVYNADGNVPMDGFNRVVQDIKEQRDLKRDAPSNELADLTALRQAQAELGVKGK